MHISFELDLKDILLKCQFVTIIIKLVLMQTRNKILKRINRVVMPNATQESFNRNTDLQFFYKIRTSSRLLNDTFSVQKPHNQHTSHNKSAITKKVSVLNNPYLDIAKQPKKIISAAAPLTSRSLPKMKNKVNRKSQLDITHDSQIANISKTISGTKLGALSAYEILQKIALQQQKQVVFYPLTLKNMQSSDTNEQYNQYVDQTIPIMHFHRRAKPDRNRQKKINSTRQSLLQTIYGGESDGFLDVYRQQQKTLMEKNSYYKSKELALDYKNDWRI